MPVDEPYCDYEDYGVGERVYDGVAAVVFYGVKIVFVYEFFYHFMCLYDL